MRIRKLLLILSFAAILTVETISLSFTLVAASTTDVAIGILRVLFYSYMLALSALFISQATVAGHDQTILHLGALTFFSSLLEVFSRIFPDTPPVVQIFADTAILTLWTISLTLNILSTVLVFTLPMGPTLHYPPSLVYSSSIDLSSAVAIPTVANVCGSTSASLLSTIIFSYTTPVVYLGQRLTSLEIHDLPIVPVAVRAIYNYHLFRAAPAISNTPWALAYKLFTINRGLFVYMFFLTAISAVIFYAPAFFLRRLVQYLQDDPKRENRGWGFVEVIGLFCAMTISNLSAYPSSFQEVS